MGRNGTERLRQSTSAIKAARRRVTLRDGNFCKSCGKSGDDIQLTLDHIIPLYFGGKNVDSNYQLLCEPCNQKKDRIDHAKYELVKETRRVAYQKRKARKKESRRY